MPELGSRFDRPALFLALGCLVVGCRDPHAGQSTQSVTSAASKGPATNPPEPPVSERAGVLRVGERVPSLRGLTHTGGVLSLEQLRDHVLLIYFCVRHTRPACQREARAVRDRWHLVRDSGSLALGVSQEDGAWQRAFASEEKLPFYLISDANGEWGRAFGVPLRGGEYGSTYSVVVDERGEITQLFEASAQESASRLAVEHLRSVSDT